MNSSSPGMCDLTSKSRKTVNQVENENANLSFTDLAVLNIEFMEPKKQAMLNKDEEMLLQLESFSPIIEKYQNKKIFDINVNIVYITRIRRRGWNRVGVDITTAKDANNIVEKIILRILTYILPYALSRITSRAVVSDIDLNISEKEIKNTEKLTIQLNMLKD
ncbi:hypothetical protein HHI36_005284 [Cryptolaemus montrouzieri]|uniref:Uncharacterized protein n=1 Tax=Cryptolaemus montrouzieri TaxID=559131 RepID=A0ABD2NTX8_9CUCU